MNDWICFQKNKEGLYTGTAVRAPCCLGMLTQNVIMLRGKNSRKISKSMEQLGIK